jgi:hypothetical protein
MLIESVESPVSWSPAGRRAGMDMSRERGREQEEKDDRRGRAVSERTGASARVGRADGPHAMLGRARGSERERGHGRERMGGPHVC